MQIKYYFRYLLALIYLILGILQLTVLSYHPGLVIGIMAFSFIMSAHLYHKNRHLADPLLAVGILALLSNFFKQGGYLFISVICLIFGILILSDTFATHISRKLER